MPTDTDPCIFFGKKVKAAREALKISQEKLAELSSLDRTYISGVERGKRNIGLRNIFKIAEALDVPAHQLLETTQSEANHKG